jgi:hypothetical protein
MNGSTITYIILRMNVSTIVSKRLYECPYKRLHKALYKALHDALLKALHKALLEALLKRLGGRGVIVLRGIGGIRGVDP